MSIRGIKIMTDMLIRRPEEDGAVTPSGLKQPETAQTPEVSAGENVSTTKEDRVAAARARIDKGMSDMYMDEAKATEHRILGIDGNVPHVTRGNLDGIRPTTNPDIDRHAARQAELKQLEAQPGPAVVTAEMLDANNAANGHKPNVVQPPKGFFGKIIARLAGDAKTNQGE